MKNLLAGSGVPLWAITEARVRKPAFPTTVSDQTGVEFTLSVAPFFIFKEASPPYYIIYRFTQLLIEKLSWNVPFFILFWPPRF